MNKNVALIGNPNVGKTTLFNALTGSHQKVGNLCGVTVEKKEGRLKGEKDIIITDLPGIYSLNAKSEDEKAVLTFLQKTPPDIIINIVDGTNLERNLYLTEKLKFLSVPIILAVNMSDEMARSGIILDHAKLERDFGVKVIAISAKKKSGIDKIINAVKTVKVAQFENQNLSDEKTFEKIEKILSVCLKKQPTKNELFTLKADRILTHKYLGFPIFALILTAVYFLSLTIGNFFGDKMGEALEKGITAISSVKIFSQLPAVIHGLIFDGILKGISTVLTFLPVILVLFFCLAILEESGYMARVSFLFDKAFRKIGLGGKSVIPLVLSCGCTVTGVMATRTIENKTERLATVILCPFMPCGAKMAVFAYLADKLFFGNPFIAVLAYFFGAFAVMVFGKLLAKLKVFKGKSSFLLEIPVLRFPKVSDVIYVLFEKIKDFLIKAGTVILSVSIILWILNHFGFSGYTEKAEESFLFNLGNGIKYIFYPLGFCSWQTSVSLLSGVLAKEAIMESLELIALDIGSLFNNAFSVFAFMAFIILSPPCIAALSQIKRELNSRKLFVMTIAFEFLAAYLSALIINVTGTIILSFPHLIFILIAVIILIRITVALSAKSCAKCEGCKRKKGGKVCRNRKNRNTTI